MTEQTNISGLPVNLDDLIQGRGRYEDHRVEFKAGWDEYIKPAAVRTVCAFANDFHNQNGGYIILGIAEQDGRPLLPPLGLGGERVDEIQKEIAGACKGRISPEYLPLIFLESFQDRIILVIWAPAGDNRPYEAPARDGGKRVYWVRSGSQTIEAKGDLQRQLMEQAGKIPFDDRRSLAGSVGDISLVLVKKFLTDVRSHLVEMDWPAPELFRRLRLVVPVNAHEVPRNVALMFFTEDPEIFFRGARIEVVQFGDDAGGDLIEEKEFRGPLPQQVRSCLNYLDGLGGSMLHKVPGQAEVERTAAYPYEAMEEALVNAVYHRSYEFPPEPVKVYLYPDRMEITSYPGPMPGLKLEHIRRGQVPSVPLRNRRIGEFLKDLRLAEARGTGIAKIKRRMRENGSPEAVFDFDDDRTYFRVILPVHPRYQVLHALREAAQLWATGEKPKAIAHLERALEQQPGSGALAGQLIEYCFGTDRVDRAQAVLTEFEKQERKNEASRPFLALARLLLDRGLGKEAVGVLQKTPSSPNFDEIVELAILKKRSKDYEGAHLLFSQAYSLFPDDPKIIHEFAQTKNNLARDKKDATVRKRLNQEARELLHRAIQLCADDTRQAWLWFDLARTLEWLRSPRSEVEGAFLKARSLLPNETRFSEAHQQWKNKNADSGNRRNNS